MISRTLIGSFLSSGKTSAITYKGEIQEFTVPRIDLIHNNLNSHLMDTRTCRPLGLFSGEWKEGLICIENTED